MSQSPEDDRTVLFPAHPPAAADDAQASSPALPNGTRLGEFEITGILGKGGFGIVYLAHDSSLERQVALKEYMPSFAWRAGGAHVTVSSPQNADSFEAGRRSFINEARMLAQFDHPSLVKVYRFWEANGTAYMVMPFYRGQTLKQVLTERGTGHGAAPDEAWLKALLAPLLDALEVIHQHQCFHRDIAPDNIIMLDEGRPLLLDFGAARRAIGDLNQAFTVILKQNYAPIEQYAEMPGMRQGPWTDLYALASVIHFAIDGQAPPAAVGRMLADPYVPLAVRHAGRYSMQFLDAIDHALAFRPDNRPQSVGAMRTELDLDGTGQRMQPVAAAPSTPSVSDPAPAMPSPPLARRRTALLAAGTGAVLLVLAAGSWLAYPARNPPGPMSVPIIETAAPVATPFSAATALAGVLAGASSQRLVTVDVPTPRARIDRDRIGFSLHASHAGHVYVYMIGTRGDDFHLLFPNAIDGDNRIAAGATMPLPRTSWPIEAVGPPGINRFVVMVSDAPRDFSGAGLVDGEDFAAFPLARAAELQRAYTGATPLFAGVPVCQGTPCGSSYGAAAFVIEEVAQ